MTHRSYSQVRQLRECGEAYRLSRIERVAERPNTAAVAGTAVHTGTETVDWNLAGGQTDREALVEMANLTALEALDAEIAKNREHGWEPLDYKRYGRATKEKPAAEDTEWFRNHGIPLSIRAYVDWRLENPKLTLAVIPGFGPAIEVPFNYYIGTQLIHGFIDRVLTDVDAGGYYPLDLKSGRKPKTDEQLGLYAKALNKALGWNVEWGYYLYGLKTGVAKLTPPLHVSHWDDEKLGRVYLPATQLIDMGIFMPNPGEACQHCSVSDHCRFVQAVT